MQSYCYREFKTLPSLIAQVQASGVDAIELCGVHANFSDPKGFEAILRPFCEASIEIVAIGVETLVGDAARDRAPFEFCRLSGAKYLGVTFAPSILDGDGLRRVDDLSAEYDVRVGIHNHGGHDWLGNEAMLAHVFGKTSRVGLHMDTGWALDANQDPLRWVERFGERLYAVHVKDFLYDERRHWRDVVLGDGMLEVAKLMAALNRANFGGPLIVEYEADANAPAAAIRQCAERLVQAGQLA